MNVQFAVKGDDVYLLEVNPRASRTVPFVSKVTGQPLAKIAARVMAGRTLAELGVREIVPRARRRQGGGLPVREVPRHRHAARARDALDRRGHGHRPRLRARLRQGADRRRHAAADRSRAGRRFHQRARRGQGRPSSRSRSKLHDARLRASSPRTAPRATSASAASPADGVNKVLEGRPHCVDAIVNGEFAMVINTTVGGAGDPRLVLASAARR